MMLSRIACVLFLALAPTLASPAHAAPDIRAIDPTLGDLRFGDGWETIAKWLGKRLDKVYLPRIQRAVDGNEKARLRARRDQEIGLVQNAEVLFDGRPTGFEQSVIAGEFGEGTAESLFVYKDGEDTHYFFMRAGKLWKYIRSFGEGVSFKQRLQIFQESFGPPMAIGDESDGNGGKRIVSATWANVGFDFRLVDRRLFFGTDLIAIEDRSVATELKAARAAAKKAGLGGVDPSVEGFFLDDPDMYGAPKPEPAPDVVPGPKPPPKSPPNGPKQP
ncbi:MAG: hypothetical protein JNJ59_00090 [Deltaproteobacteria bacterium]|nr:hypothetical protein [Deltaproteobacteria bacterium]